MKLGKAERMACTADVCMEDGRKGSMKSAVEVDGEFDNNHEPVDTANDCPTGKEGVESPKFSTDCIDNVIEVKLLRKQSDDAEDEEQIHEQRKRLRVAKSEDGNWIENTNNCSDELVDLEILRNKVPIGTSSSTILCSSTSDYNSSLTSNQVNRVNVCSQSVHSSTSSVAVRRSCPYLGTVNRHLLDFDFEKLCSICMSNQHVYACLVCGKYFQGRGKKTYCFTHALEEGHNVYINLSDRKVYCLPDNYEVHDASLDDIRYFLNPTYTEEDVKQLNIHVIYGKALDGTDFLPGCIGLNNLKQTDFFNVIIQLICSIIFLRNYLLLLDTNSGRRNTDTVLTTLSDLIKKIYNPKNFKGIVSPHEFLQAVGVASEKRFRIGVQKDPVAFFSWLMSRIHSRIKIKKTNSSIIHYSLEGEVLVTVSEILESGEIKMRKKEKTSFLFLTLNLPDAPIFKDSLDRNMIPQVPIFDLLQKFDGETTYEVSPGELRCYSLWRLPPYLIFVIKRFSKNNFFVEKNPTIVTFPIKNLDLREHVSPDALNLNPVCQYNLVANICHHGKPQGGVYKIYVLHSPTNEWYEIEDLRVIPVLPQYVAVSESYIQVYQRVDVMPDGTLNQDMREETFADIEIDEI